MWVGGIHACTDIDRFVPTHRDDEEADEQLNLLVHLSHDPQLLPVEVVDEHRHAVQGVCALPLRMPHDIPDDPSKRGKSVSACGHSG